MPLAHDPLAQGAPLLPANQPPPAAEPAAPVSAPVPRQLSETERKFQRQMNEYRRWTALAKKADLLAALPLPAEKFNALKDLLAERDIVERDARDAARNAGVDPRQAAAVEAAKIDARIHALLGDGDYAVYTEHTSLAVFREQLEGSPIPGCLVDAGAPLTAEQKNWLADMMYRTFGAELVDGAVSARTPDPAHLREVFKNAVLTQGPTEFTPPQLDALREYFRKDDELAGHLNTLIQERARPK